MMYLCRPRVRVFVAAFLFLFVGIPVALMVSRSSIARFAANGLDFRILPVGGDDGFFNSNVEIPQESSPEALSSEEERTDTGKNHDDGKTAEDYGENDEDNDNDLDDDDDGDDDDDEDDDDDDAEGKGGNSTQKKRARLNTGVHPKDIIRAINDSRQVDVLKQLLDTLGDYGPFPAVVGGIGDSGTRGIREVLRAFRVQMLGERYVNRQGDSHVFEALYPVYDAKSKTWSERRAREMYKQGIARAQSVRYNESFFSAKAWEHGRQWAGAMLWRSRHISAMMKAERSGEPLEFWGMKHPRSMLTLPILASALGDKIRFVHVFRDAKEVVSGDNQKMFSGHCRKYYGLGRYKCSPSFEKKYEFWADANTDAIRIAERYLSSKSYLAVRIEDFVAGNQDCFRRLARFVGIPDGDIDRDMARALNTTVPHASSYFGQRRGDSTKNELYRELQAAPPRVRNLMDALGYSHYSFKLKKTCFELPGPR